jgi:hypothetical protein
MENSRLGLPAEAVRIILMAVFQPIFVGRSDAFRRAATALVDGSIGGDAPARFATIGETSDEYQALLSLTVIDREFDKAPADFRAMLAPAFRALRSRIIEILERDIQRSLHAQPDQRP